MRGETKNERRRERRQRIRGGTAAALLETAKECSRIVQPGDVEELERLIDEECEPPGEVEEFLARPVA
jgi:hypothetical protein